MEDLQFQPSSTRGRSHIRHFGRRVRKIRIDQHSDRARPGNKFAQQFEPFRPECRRKKAHAGGITARPVETGDEASLDGIGCGENDWNR